jgi:nucleoid DNA-binding protein
LRPKQVNVFSVLSLNDLVDLVASRTGIFKKDVRTVLDTMREVVLEQVASGNAVRWHQFGIFLPLVRFTRERQPDGSTKMVPARHRLGFAFYPSATVSNLKPTVDVERLLERGDYNGPSHRYTL